MEVEEASCTKSNFTLVVMSLNVTGDVPCGPGAGGVLGKSGAVYGLPVWGVGDGAGCCPIATTTKIHMRLKGACLFLYDFVPLCGKTYLLEISVFEHWSAAKAVISETRIPEFDRCVPPMRVHYAQHP